MNFESAQDAFVKLVADLDNDKMSEFFRWIQSAYLVSHCRGYQPAEAYTTLRDIAADIKELVPTSAILNSEKLIPPTEGDSVDYDPRHTVHVDGFLFDEMDIDELVNDGKLERNYCKDCDSHNTAPLNYITHSASRDSLDFIFSSLLPYLKGKTVVDVGSRLGPMLYGAYLYTPAPKIIGIEMNSELCEIQNKIIQKHGFADRIEVLNNDLRDVPDTIKSADIVILHNVFEFFMSKEEQVSCWQFLKNNVKTGAILLTIPSLDISLKNINCGIDIGTWVQKRPFTDPLIAMHFQDQDEISRAVCYDIIG